VRLAKYQYSREAAKNAAHPAIRSGNSAPDRVIDCPVGVRTAGCPLSGRIIGATRLTNQVIAAGALSNERPYRD
jgi:hypothetical protein